jgi:hypothetical protein
MAITDSAFDPEAVQRARRLLAPRTFRERAWPVLLAAAFAAVSALTLAATMILAPPPSEQLVRDSNGVLVRPR